MMRIIQIYNGNDDCNEGNENGGVDTSVWWTVIDEWWTMKMVDEQNFRRECWKWKGGSDPLPTTITGLNIMVGITMNGKLSQ